MRILVMTGLLLGFASGCCEGTPEEIWNAADFPENAETTWRCDGPIGNVCFVFYRLGNVVITEQAAGGSHVHNWELDCSGLLLDGTYDEAVLSSFDGSIAERSLRFHFDWSAVDISGDMDCALENLDPAGHACP